MKTKTTHVFLSHGLESSPGSTKIQALKNVAETFDNVQAHAIDHTSSKDPAVRMAQMNEAISASGAAPENIILAGSSMGGWVCAQTSAHTRFRVLPASASTRNAGLPSVQPPHTSTARTNHSRLG